MAELFNIYHDLVVDSSLPKVFEAVSQPDQLTKWWPLTCAGDPSVGSEYSFFFSPKYDWRAEVKRVESPGAFHLKMTQADEDWLGTELGFDLEETANGVLLHFQHVGWPECNAHFKQSSFCWAMLLNGLKNYLENGIVIPFEQRE